MAAILTTLARDRAPSDGSVVQSDRRARVHTGIVLVTDNEGDVVHLRGPVRLLKEMDRWGRQSDADDTADRARFAETVADRVVGALRVAEQDECVLASPEEQLGARTRVAQDTVLRDVALMERVARRLRRFVRGLATHQVEVVPDSEALRIDDPTRALARRLLARSGFVPVDR